MHVRSIANNSILLFSGRIISRIFDFFFFVLLAAYLGPEKMGAYNFVFALVGLFAVFVDLGLNPILIRENSQHPEHTPEVMGNGLLIGFIMSGFFMFLSAAVMQFLPVPAETKRLVFIACLSILLSSRFKSFRTLLEVMFTVNLRMGYIALFNVLDRVLVLGSFLLLVSYNPSLLIVMVCVVFGDIPGFVLTAVMYRKYFGRLNFKPDYRLIRTLLGYSLPIFLMGIFNFLNFRVDVFILEFLRGQADVGFYSTGTKVMEVFYFIPTAFGLSLVPILSRKIITNRAAFIEVFETGARYLLVLATPMVVYLFVEAETIILLLFKKEYIPSIPVLQVVAFAGIPFFVEYLFSQSLVIIKKEKLLFIIIMFSAFTHIGLTLIFIKIYGMVGAALATVTAYSLDILFGIFFKNSREFTVGILKAFFKPAVAGIIMGAILLLIQMNFIIAFFVGSSVYIVVLLLLRGFTTRDREFIMELISTKKSIYSFENCN